MNNSGSIGGPVSGGGATHLNGNLSTNNLSVGQSVNGSGGLNTTPQLLNSNNNIISARTGHSMTPFDDKLIVIGGSMGSSYKKDFFVL